MAAQTNYGEKGHGWAGRTPSSSRQVDTYVVGDEDGVDYGIAVVKGSGRQTCVKHKNGGIFVGVTMSKALQVDSKYRRGDNADILRDGDICVRPVGEIADLGAPVYVVPGTGQFTPVAEGNDLLRGATWTSLADAKGIAIVRIGSGVGF